MQQCKIRRLPIVQNEELIGIITEKDIEKDIANDRSIICELLIECLRAENLFLRD